MGPGALYDCGVSGKISLDNVDLKGWIHRIGSFGEINQIFTSDGSDSVNWVDAKDVNDEG